MKISAHPFAFALVEVTIALGIAAYALVGIIGLLSVAHSGSGASTNETVLVMIVDEVTSALRQERFSVLAQQSSTTTPVAVPGSPSYYDVSGKKIVSAGGGVPPNALYLCTKTMQGDANTIASGAPHLLRVKVELSWPATAPTNTKTIYVDLGGN